jgi:radical SAM family uncharacterized protein
VRAYREKKEKRGEKKEFLRRAANIEGIYVPMLYDVSYNEDGTLASMKPSSPDAPIKVKKRVVIPLPPAPTKQIVPLVEAVHDRAMIEIQRGCTQGCRFCQAGYIYRPLRERPLEEVLETVDAILEETGYEEVALLSLSTTDHSQIEDIVSRLVLRYREPPLFVSLPSLRTDSFSVELAEMIRFGRRTGLTFAPEAGSQRLRDCINKNIKNDDLLRTAEAAYSKGWQRIKLYFMIGLPTETLEDVVAIANLVKKVVEIGRRYHGKRTKVSISLATFVPKAHTPFQWLPLIDEKSLMERQKLLRNRLKEPGISLSWHDPRKTLLEAALSRGDRRLGRVIYRAWKLGARFDAWEEAFDEGNWLRAFEEDGLNPDFYARRVRSLDEILPWDHIDVGVSKGFLLEEYRRSLRGEVTADCRKMCRNCGLKTTFNLIQCPSLAPLTD